jgi:hypothetical protein
MKPEEPVFVVRQAPDLLDRRKLARVTAGSLVVFALATAGAWYLLEASRRSPALVAASAPVGTVETALFSTAERGLTLHAQQREALEHYGWVDRDAGIARIPIERAMDLLIEQAEGGAP